MAASTILLNNCWSVSKSRWSVAGVVEEATNRKSSNLRTKRICCLRTRITCPRFNRSRRILQWTKATMSINWFFHQPRLQRTTRLLKLSCHQRNISESCHQREKAAHLNSFKAPSRANLTFLGHRPVCHSWTKMWWEQLRQSRVNQLRLSTHSPVTPVQRATKKKKSRKILAGGGRAAMKPAPDSPSRHQTKTQQQTDDNNNW